MSEPHENITDQPHDGPRTTDLTNEAPFAHDCGALQPYAFPSVTKSNLKRYSLLAGLGGFLLFVIGLGIVGVVKLREFEGRLATQNNLRLMGTAVNAIAANTATGDIPSSNGVFPRIGAGVPGSFFYHLLPFVEPSLYVPNPGDFPVKWYIFPADSRNPGTNSTISYCTNGTLLGQPNPRLPNSFGGRTSQVVVVMERSGLDGAHKWTNTNNVLGAPGQPPPFPQIGVPPAVYLETSPQSFTTIYGVCMGDGCARYITGAQQDSWNWACDPTDPSPPPTSW